MSKFTIEKPKVFPEIRSSSIWNYNKSSESRLSSRKIKKKTFREKKCTKKTGKHIMKSWNNFLPWLVAFPPSPLSLGPGFMCGGGMSPRQTSHILENLNVQKRREHQVSTMHCRIKKMIRYYSISYHTIYIYYIRHIPTMPILHIIFYHHLINVSSWHVISHGHVSKDVGPPSPLWCRSQGTASRQLKRWSCWRSGAGGPFLWGWAIHGCWEMKMFGVTTATCDPNL